MVLYDNVLELAQKKGVTIQNIEKTCGLSGGIISKWRENNNPKLDNVRKVADFFGVSIDELIADK